MAEITRQDLVSDEALQAPVILTKEFEKLLSTVDLVVASSKKYSDALSGNTGLKDTQETTKKLTDEQRVLAQVSKQIATETAKQSQVYQQQATVLKDLKEQQKQRNALGEKEAINVRAANSSIKELSAALNANRAAYAALRTEEERSSETGKQLLTVIQQQDEEFKSLSKSIGQSQPNVGNYEGALAGLKAELKAARGEMVAIGETLGQSSKQYQDAAKRAGEIADKIGDAKDEAKAFQGDTAIENLGTRFGLLGEKVRSLDFKGAATQIKGIADLSKGMTFKEAISGLGGFGSALAQLGKALLTNPIFLIAGTIAAAVMAFSYFKDQAEKLTQSTIERLDREMKAINLRYDLEIRLLRAAKKETQDKEIAQHEEFIRIQNEKIQKLTDVSDWQYILATNFFFSEKSYNEKRRKDIQELTDSIKQSENDIAVLKAEKLQKDKEDQKKALDELLEKQKEIRKRVSEIMKDASEKDIDTSSVDPTELFLGEDVVNKTRSKLDEVYAELNKAQKEANNKEFKAKEEHQAKMLETDLEYSENKKKLLKKEVEEIVGQLSEIQGYYNQFSSAILSLSTNLTAAKVADIDSEINAEKERANQEILLAGGNAEAKVQIKAQSELRIAALEKKKKEEQRKAAQLEKDFALVQAGILTAINILKVFPNPLLMALAATLGGIQIAAINAKPLPQYYKGVDNHPGGYAMVGEKGAELMRMPSGEFRLTPNRPTVMDLPTGTEVIPNRETMRMLAMAGMGTPERIDSPRDQRLLNEVRELKQITAKNRPSQTNLARNMATVYEWKEESETHKKKIRALSMGSWF